MTIDGILNNEPERQREFPVCRERVFLGHAAVCAMPARVANAMTDCVMAGTTDDQENLLGTLLYGTRELAAGILNASVREIALVGPTSLALSYVAAGLEFQAGDNVVCYFEDYPSNVYPWMALREKGVEIRYIKTCSLGQIEPDDVFAQVDDKTRLVALASCHFITGWQIDIDTIGKGLRERGVLFCLDAIQTVGAIPSSVEHVDFLAADAHKWMLGPCSAGILYVRQELQDQLKPLVFGWHNVECPEFVTLDRIELKKDARRYEVGSHNIAGMSGLKAALELLVEIGIENIATELSRKRAHFISQLLAEGWDVSHHDAPKLNQGPMYSLTKDGVDLSALHARLAENKITVSLRSDGSGKHHLRLSPHFYNTDTELEQVLAHLKTA